MPHIRIPYSLRRYTNTEHIFSSDGKTIHELLDAFGRSFPGLTPVVFSSEGQLHDFIRIYVNGEEVRLPHDLNRKLDADANITLITGIAGG